MALAPPPPPAGHAEALARWLGQFARQLGPSPRTLRPLPVYGVGREDLAAGHLLDRARLLLWRSLVLDAGGGLHALDLAPPDQPGGTWTFGGIASGELAAALRARLEDAARHAGEGDELRLLLSAAPLFEAYWLHGRADVLVPIRDQDGLAGGGAHDPAQVLAALSSEAQRSLETGRDGTN